jgi:FixJ family two-component response regulator
MSARRKTVAIIDDDPGVLRALESLLHAHDIATEVYASGEDYIERFAASKAICLVLDVHLPGISGLELGRLLAAAGFRPPIIFMTADDSETTKKAAVDAGCIAFLRKPFPSHHLIGPIEDIDVS